MGQITSASGDWAGEAKELMNSGEYDKALDVINAALSSGESKDLCYVQRANVYKKMGEYQKAIDDYDKAISLNPAMPYYLAMKGDVYVLMGEYQKGIDQYDSALQKNIGYEPLVQSVKSSREDAYQKMRDAENNEGLDQKKVGINFANSIAEERLDKNDSNTEQTNSPQLISSGSDNSPPEIACQKCLGGSEYDYLGSLIQTSDGGYLLRGYTESNNGDVSGNHGGEDSWIVKLMSSGVIEWQKCLGGGEDEYLGSLIQTSDGGYVLVGYTESNDGDVSGNHGGRDAWVVKLTNSGVIEWQKCFGGSNNDNGNEIIQTSDGGYLLKGYTESNDGDVSGNHGGSKDAWVIKLTSSGAIEWQKCLGGSNNDNGKEIIQTSDGGYILLGFSASNDGDVSGNHGGGGDVWVVKLTNSGVIEWQKCLGGSEYDKGEKIIQTSDGGYALTMLTCRDYGVLYYGHPGELNTWVVKLTSSGAIEWQKCLGENKNDNGNEIIQTSDGGYVLTGSTKSNDGDVSGNHGEKDVWVVKLTNSGVIEWEKCFGGSNNDNGNEIIQTSDGGYILTGKTGSNDGDVSGHHGDMDIWVVKLSPDGETISETSITQDSNTGSLSLTTTPSGAQVTLDGSLQTGQTPLTLSDILAGSHDITFSKSGYLDVSMTVPIIPDETSEFSILLSPEPNGLSTTSDNSQEKQEIDLKESQGEDLTVDEIALVYYKADSNDLSTDLKISNIGTAPTSRFTITYFLTPEQISIPFMDPIGKEIILGRDDISTLDAGESRQASTMKTFSLSGISPGKYWFGLFIDSQNSIAETDEGNNVLYWEEQIIL